MFRRRILSADIVRANKDSDPHELTMSDFATGPLRAQRAAEHPKQPAFPCFIDIGRARTLYVPNLDVQQLREAPFSGLYASHEARSILLVPWEAGPINHPRVDADPIYLFSPGRCGSTLVHNILVSARINSVSEPDIGGALISQSYQRYRITRPVLRWVTETFVRDLVSALGSDDGRLVVKLRSQFCAAAPALLRNTRERRTIFMTRRFETWAKSVAQLFWVSSGYLVAEYRRSLLCYWHLRQHTNCHFLRFEDFMERPDECMERLGSFLGKPISRESIDRAMSVSSQRGTRLERVSEKGRERWESMREETLRRWTSSRTAELCEHILAASSSQ